MDGRKIYQVSSILICYEKKRKQTMILYVMVNLKIKYDKSLKVSRVD